MNQGKLPVGQHRLAVNLPALGLAPANYLYQITVENREGVFKSCKLMTHARNK